MTTPPKYIGPITADESAAIRRLFLEGKATYEIMSATGRSYEAVIGVLEAIKVKELPSLTGLSHLEMNRMRQAFLEGYMRADIALEWSVPIGTVNLVTFGMTRRIGTRVYQPRQRKKEKPRVTDEEREQIVSLYDHGKGVKKSQLCRQFDRSEPTIRKILEEAGVFVIDQVRAISTMPPARTKKKRA